MSNIVFLGERHQVPGTSKKIASVLSRFKRFALAFEYPKRDEKNLQQFFLRGDISYLEDVFAQADEKKTKEYFSFLVDLQKTHPGLEVFCVDVNEPSVKRDKDMAQHILAISSRPLLVYCGEFHAAKQPVSLQGQTLYSAAYYVGKKERVTSIRFTPESDDFDRFFDEVIFV